MMKIWRYLAVVGLLICVVALWWNWPHDDNDPLYSGKRLSVWLKSFSYGPQQDQDATYEILRQVGTNAVPFLLQELGASDSPLKLKLLQLAARQKIIKVEYVPADNRRQVADVALQALRPDVAKDVAPLLISLYEPTTARSSKIKPFLVLYLFGYMGPDARLGVPLLLRETTNPDVRTRRTAIWSLGQIHASPESVVPVLIISLRDPDSSVSIMAAQSLGDYGRAAQSAVPALLQLHLREMTNTDADLRRGVIRALGKIHAEPQSVVPVLITALHDSDPRVGGTAAWSLEQFGREAKPAIPNLQRLALESEEKMKVKNYYDTYRSINSAATCALSWIKDACAVETIVPALIKALDDPNYFTRDKAIGRLARFGPEAKAALPKLRDLLDEENQAIKEGPASIHHLALRGHLMQAIPKITGETAE